MACLCLDTSYKQGLMSLLVQRHSGPSQELSTSFTLQVYIEVSTVWMIEKLSFLSLCQLKSLTNGLWEVLDSYFPRFDPWRSFLRGRNPRENGPAVCENHPLCDQRTESTGICLIPSICDPAAGMCENKSHSCLDKTGPIKFDTASQHTKILGLWITGQDVRHQWRETFYT